MEFQPGLGGRKAADSSARPLSDPRMDLDASVIRRLQVGDMAAFEACYRSFGPRVQRLCRRLVGRDHAEDAAQEVFMKVFENAVQFSGKSRFSTWIYQVTLNH